MKKLLNKKGFTIVELVIVIAVIAILAAVLIPTFSNVIDSANKSSDLSEAQNTLKAYTAYTSSKGQSLNDGTVFKVTKSGRSYVFYKGSLHEFQGRDIASSADGKKYGVVLSIGNDSYKSNKMTAHYIEDDKEIEFEEAKVDSDSKQVVFFYSDTKNVTFEDGSLNCQIYPGSIAYFSSKSYTLKDGKYEISSSATAPEKVENISEIAYLTITDGDTITYSKLIKKAKSGPSSETPVVTLSEYDADSGKFVAFESSIQLPVITDTNKEYKLTKGTGVALAGDKLTIKSEYQGGTDIALTVSAKSSSTTEE